MAVDKFGRSPTTSQNVTNVSGVSHEYLNNNFLRKGQTIDMARQNILNLGSPLDPNDAVRRKYVNEKFFKRCALIDIENKPIKNVLSPIDEGDVANKSYVDSKSVGGSDLNMNGHSVRNVNQNPTHGIEVVPKEWIETHFLSCDTPSSTMARHLNMDGNQVEYLKEPEHNHHAPTKGYADTKLSVLGGDMQGGIGMSENRISHLGEPEQNNDGLTLSSGNEFYLRRDGANWMRNDLYLKRRLVVRNLKMA